MRYDGHRRNEREALCGDQGNIILKMKECGGATTDNSARTKASVGLKIFKEGINIEALKSILNAKRVDDKTRKKAGSILEREQNRYLSSKKQ